MEKLSQIKKTNMLLGAQLVGYEGVDKRLDVLVTAITPYSLPRDPLYYTGIKLR